jgi:EAL domain-containing protein (putative c-di-GMP-specific phosphodiesterase class I)
MSLAGGFGQQTVAEGVERCATLNLLCDLGVDYRQGYVLGRPAPAESLLSGRHHL